MEVGRIQCTDCGSMKIPCLCSLSYHKFDTSNYIKRERTEPFLITREAHDALISENVTLRARITELEADNDDLTRKVKLLDATVDCAQNRISVYEKRVNELEAPPSEGEMAKLAKALYEHTDIADGYASLYTISKTAIEKFMEGRK